MATTYMVKGDSNGNILLPYKVYKALLTQSGTDDPVAVVLQNTLGGDVIWQRDNIGIYTGLLPIEFEITKGIIDIGLVAGSGFDIYNPGYRFAYFTISVSLIDRIQIITGLSYGTSNDDLLQILQPTYIYIEAHP